MGERRPNTRLRWAVVVVAATVGIAAGGIGAALLRAHGTGADAWVTPALQAQLGLTPMDGRPAPAFDLVDQHGRRVSLSSLRGHPVVLEFMDPRCTDICPIVSQEFLGAARLLGPRARDVAFVAVNVNQFHRTTADLLAFSREHRLTSLPTWHFLTGPTPALQRVWKDYGVVVLPNPTGDVVHSSLVYFVDGGGRIRYAAWPTKAKGAIPAWSRGIADVVRHLR